MNNKGLRDWLNSSGRGTPQPDQWHIGNGDIINYSWQGSCYDGDVDHVVIVTGSDSNGPLVCSHNADLCDFPWGALTCGGLTFQYATFSSINDCFSGN